MEIPKTCEFDPAVQKEKSTELLRLAAEDQADRDKPYEQIDWQVVSPRDLQRREKVAVIFAGGCFKTASDYASAATVYQHGTAAGLDRYLVKIGHKQMFGTQFFRPPEGPA